MNVDELLDEIEFNKKVGMGTSLGSCKLVVEVIEIEDLIPILAKHIPEIKNYINDNTTISNNSH